MAMAALPTMNCTGNSTTPGKDFHSSKNEPYFYDSQGDYGIDAWHMEDPSLPLYQLQSQLPKLPVPSIEHSLQLVLQSSLPLASNPEELESLKRAVDKFPLQAKLLQERLEQRAKVKSQASNGRSSSTSWLQQYWNEQGYLQPRCSNVIHVSYFFRYQLLHNNRIAERGAAMLHKAAHYAEEIRNGTRPVDTLLSRNKTTPSPLCSSQFKYLFGACRIPGLEQDRYRLYHHSHKNCTTTTEGRSKTPVQAVVAFRGQFFSIPLISDTSGATVLPQWQLLQSLNQVSTSPSFATETTAAASAIPELGWLTTQSRQNWYRDYCFLRNVSPLMQKALETLQSGLIMLCLDEPAASDRDLALRLWHGCDSSSSCNDNGAHQSSGRMNRWWDKSMQLVLCEKTEPQQQQPQLVMGYIGEHCMADGMPAVDFCQQMQRAEYDKSNGDDSMVPGDTMTSPVTQIFADAWASLDEVSRRHIRERVEHARKKHLAVTHQYDLQILQYEKYGSRFIKELAGVSPDAFVQMAMQLAACRYFRSPAVATYESTQTRQFLHGRTETTRSVSPQSVAFCQAMLDSTISTENCDAKTSARNLELLRQACDAHSHYTLLATNGMGCDRHLFGLENCLRGGESAPDLFVNPLYLKSKRWVLSTSTLPGTSPGFGPVQDDGFGIGYDIAHEHMVFTCTCLRSQNDAIQFRDAIKETLDDLMSLVLRHGSRDGSAVSSKL